MTKNVEQKQVRTLSDKVRHSLRKSIRGERGDALPFFLLVAPILVASVGLAYDGGNILVAKRGALNVASASARAGVGDVSERSLYNGNPEMAPSAGSTAAVFASSEGYVASGVSFNGSKTKMQVTVSKDVDMAFLTILGLNSVTVTESAIAEVEIYADDE